MKTIYLIRHSNPGKTSILYKFASLQTKNEKRKLTKEGKEYAEEFFNNTEFNKIEEIYSSNYIRARETANILARRLNLKVKIDPNFGERKIGIKSWKEYPKDYEIHQFNDNDYKIGNGESLNEVKNRELISLNNILNESKANTIAIIFHSTAAMILLKTWCDISYDSNYYYKDKVFFDGKWNYCETFKLEFDDKNNLINITNIREKNYKK